MPRQPFLCALIVLWITPLPSDAWTQDPTTSELQQQLDKVKKSVASDTYTLRYKLRAGDKLNYRVEHLASVDTTIQGNRQTSKSRSISTKTWDVQQVDAEGKIHFAHSIQDVDMWSQINDREPIRYQSGQGSEPPPEYEAVAQTVGKPLAVVTMDQRGNIVERKDEVMQLELGFGGLVVPLPDEPIRVGTTWSVPSVVRVRLSDGNPKIIKTRQLYELKRVDVGVATISVKTEVLTPVDDARTRSQLIQRLSSGQVKFDVDAGRILAKEMAWNETVVGFDGPKSNMEYVAEFTEKLIPPTVETARTE